jgi:hypothetical protein
MEISDRSSFSKLTSMFGGKMGGKITKMVGGKMAQGMLKQSQGVLKKFMK